MSKIAIIGHPASGYQEVEALLHQYGMGQAQPSRRDGLSPLQITATLCQAHNAPPLDAVADEEEIRQIDAGAIWHGLALDLMLGNLNQPLWGWADPQAIYTLDYWSGLDPQMRFVLVYDEPHRVLMEAARAEGHHPSIDSLRRQLDNWVAYNGVLLRFYLRHPGRCLLIHARQTQQTAGNCLRQLQNLLDTPLALPAEEQNPAQPLLENTEQPGAAASSAVSTVLSQLTQAEHLKLEDLSAAANASATERYLADGVLADYPKALQLYAELQSAASLPLDKTARAAASAALAWETWVRQRAFVFDLLSSIHAQYRAANDALTAAHQQVENKTTALADLHRQIEYKQAESRQENQRLLTQLQQAQLKLEAEHKQAQDKAAALADLQRQIEHQQAEGSQENKLLLSQLFQVQEELERNHLENQRLKDAGQRAANDAQAALKQAQDKAAALAAAQKQVADKDTALATARKQAEDKAAALAAAQKQAQDKAAALAAAQKQVADKDTALATVHQQIQDKAAALAAAQKQAQDKAAALAAAQKQVADKDAALATARKQAEDKAAALATAQKQAQDKAAALADLQRQSEHKQAESSQENELLLSQLFQVQEELERHHLENQRLKDAGQRAANDAQAALKQAQDKATALAAAQKQVADKDAALAAVRKQAEDKAAALADLQRQIDRKQAASRQENQLLLSQLHQVQKELERYGQENQRLKNPPKPPGPLGAAARVKEQLTYRLGAVMVSHNTLGGWLTLPWALAAETRAFRKEHRARGPVKQPPIHTYLDAAEAERVKQHLSYRLGSVLIQHAKSPPRWFTLPFALRREVREFRRTRKTASK